MNYVVTTVRLSKEMLSEIRELGKMLGKDQSEVIREALRQGLRELKTRLVLDLYVREKISLGRAAELSGLSMWQLVEELKRRGLVIKYGDDRFREEVEELCK